MTNIVATGISGRLTAAQKAAIRASIDLDKGVRDYSAFIKSLLSKATISLDFVNNLHKTYGAFGLTEQSLSAAMVAGRATSATYYTPWGIASAAANTARVTYDPITGAPLGLLCQETRTNKLLQTENFTSASWTQSPVADVEVTANVITAPDGTNTADKFYEATTANTFHDIFQAAGAAFTAGVMETLSIYVSAAERAQGSLVFASGPAFTTERQVAFDLNLGTAVAFGTGATAGIEKLPNSWFRVWVTATPENSGVGNVYFRLRNDSGESVYAGTVGRGMYIWGIQLETGRFPTSYIPNAASYMTRNSDGNHVTVPLVIEGTMFIECSGENPVAGNNQVAVNMSDGTENNRILIRRNNDTNGSQFAVIAGATNIFNINTTLKSKGVTTKFAISFKRNNFICAESGNIVYTHLSGNVPSDMVNIGLGNMGLSNAGGTSLNGTIKDFWFAPRPYTADELKALTL